MRACKANSGFTLMEMLVSLFLIILIVTFAAVSVDSVSEEARLQRPATEVKSFAKRAVKSAVAEQRSYSVIFYPSFFLMRETYPEMVEEEQDFGFNLFGDAEDEEALRSIVVYKHELGDGVAVEVRRWNAAEWVAPEEEEWVFEPSGLCEPLSVRFTRKGGYVEIDFNPLTAGVQDERLYIP